MMGFIVVKMMVSFVRMMLEKLCEVEAGLRQVMMMVVVMMSFVQVMLEELCEIEMWLRQVEMMHPCLPVFFRRSRKRLTLVSTGTLSAWHWGDINSCWLISISHSYREIIPLHVPLSTPALGATSLTTGSARADTWNTEKARRVKIERIFFIVNSGTAKRASNKIGQMSGRSEKSTTVQGQFQFIDKIMCLPSPLQMRMTNLQVRNDRCKERRCKRKDVEDRAGYLNTMPSLPMMYIRCPSWWNKGCCTQSSNA